MAVEFPRPLDGQYITGIGHHADDRLVPFGVGTNGTQTTGRQIAAHGAQRHAALGIHDGVGKGLGLLHGQIQHMESQPLGGFSADTGKPGKLLHQLFKGRGKVFHRGQPLNSLMRAEISAALYTALPATNTLAPAWMH